MHYIPLYQCKSKSLISVMQKRKDIEIPKEIFKAGILNLGTSVVHEESLKKIFHGGLRKEAAVKAT